MKTVDYILPEHWLSALVNDDVTGFDDWEEVAFRAFMDDGVKRHGHFWCLGPVDDEGNGFMRYHDAWDYGVGSCDTFTVRFDVDRE
jgi:hypothetical protein